MFEDGFYKQFLIRIFNYIFSCKLSIRSYRRKIPDFAILGTLVLKQLSGFSGFFCLFGLFSLFSLFGLFGWFKSFRNQKTLRSGLSNCVSLVYLVFWVFSVFWVYLGYRCAKKVIFSLFLSWIQIILLKAFRFLHL